MVVFGLIGFMLFIFYPILCIWQDGFKDGLKSVGTIYLVIFGVSLIFFLIGYIYSLTGAVKPLAIYIFLIIVCAILAKIADKTSSDKCAECLIEWSAGILIVLRGLLLFNVLCSFFGGDSILSFVYEYINKPIPVTGIPFPYDKTVLDIFIFIFIYSLFAYRKGRKDKIADMIKDAEKITRENSACIVVQDIKGTEDTGADIKKKDRKFAINGYKMNAKKVWLLIYSILGIVVMVVKANKNTKKYDTIFFAVSLLTLLSLILYLITVRIQNKYFYKYNKKIKREALKNEKYKEVNPEVKSLLAGMWFEDYPLTVNLGINLADILYKEYKVSLSLEISPGLSALTYYKAGELLNIKYKDYIKQKNYDSFKTDYIYCDPRIKENTDLKDQEIKISFIKTPYPIEKDEHSKTFSVADEKTNEEKAEKIIQLLDDFIESEIIPKRKKSLFEDVKEMVKRWKEKNTFINIFSKAEASVNPYEFVLCYCGKELFRYNLVKCKDGGLVKTIEEIYKKMTVEEFDQMIAGEFVQKIETALDENVQLFSNYNEIVAKNKKLFESRKKS